MTIFNNLIEKLIALEILCNNVPFIKAFEVLVYFDNVRMVEFF